MKGLMCATRQWTRAWDEQTHVLTPCTHAGNVQRAGDTTSSINRPHIRATGFRLCGCPCALVAGRPPSQLARSSARGCPALPAACMPFQSRNPRPTSTGQEGAGRKGFPSSLHQSTHLSHHSQRSTTRARTNPAYPPSCARRCTNTPIATGKSQLFFLPD